MDASPKGSRNVQPDTNADWNTTADAPKKNKTCLSFFINAFSVGEDSIIVGKIMLFDLHAAPTEL